MDDDMYNTNDVQRDLFGEIIKKEIKKEKNSIKKKIKIEEKNTENNTKINGIITHTYGENTYTFWHRADVVYPVISEFLRNDLFPNSIIIEEFDKFDFAIVKENLPAEVQSTPAYVYQRKKGGIIQTINHSEFEQKIEKQLKQKTDRCGNGIFFFDSEYHRYLQNDLTGAARINWDWFYRYVKEGRLRVFTVKYDGYPKEVFLKDFEFISKISQTCPIKRYSDERVLKRNKLIILNNVLDWYKFTPEEIDKMYYTYKLARRYEGYADHDEWLNKKEDRTKREELYYYIRRAMTTMRWLNEVLACRLSPDKRSHMRVYAHYMKILGLIDSKNVGRSADLRTFTDYTNIGEFFPGYLEKKVLWDDLKTKYIKYDTLCDLVTGEINDLKGQPWIDKY